MRTFHKRHRVARRARAERSGRFRLGTAAGMCLAAALALTGLGAAAASAQPGGFTEVPETGREGYLVLRADPYPARFPGLTPGDEVAWSIQARLEDAPTGSLQLRLAGSGDLVHHPRGLEVSVRSCTGPFTSRAPHAGCTGTETEVVPLSRLADVSTDPDTAASARGPAGDRSWQLADVTADSPRYLMVTLGLPQSASRDRGLQGRTGDFGVGLYAAGEQPPDPGSDGQPEPTESASPEPTQTPAPGAGPGTPPGPGDTTPRLTRLPVTGAQILWLLLAAGLLVSTGAGLRWSHRDRRSS